MILLYGFLTGDTMGTVLLANPGDTVAMLVNKVVASASVRIGAASNLALVYKGRPLDPHSTVLQAGFEPLDRIDVVEALLE